MTTPLTEVIPPRLRGYVYAAAFVLGLALTAYEAADGDWKAALVPFLGSVVSALAGSNLPKPEYRID